MVDEIVSSNPVEVERATDLVLCEDVRSCAIDYAIRRDSRMETIRWRLLLGESGQRRGGHKTARNMYDRWSKVGVWWMLGSELEVWICTSRIEYARLSVRQSGYLTLVLVFDLPGGVCVSVVRVSACL